MSFVDFNVKALNKSIFFGNFLTLASSNNAANDYSGGLTEFSYTNTSLTETLFLSNLVIKISDDTISMTEYGGLGSALTNGINIYYTTNSGVTKNYIIGTTYNVKTNSDFLNYTTDIKLVDNVLSVNFNFQKNRANIKLTNNERIVVEVNDDFSSLDSHTFHINGFFYPNSAIV